MSEQDQHPRTDRGDDVEGAEHPNCDVVRPQVKQSTACESKRLGADDRHRDTTCGHIPGNQWVGLDRRAKRPYADVREQAIAKLHDHKGHPQKVADMRLRAEPGKAQRGRSTLRADAV